MKKLTFFLILLLLLTFSAAMISCDTKGDADPTTPDTKTVRGLNEHNEYFDSNGDLNVIRFTKIIIANSLLHEEKNLTVNYLILEGEITASSYAFDVENDNLELYIENNSIFYLPINERFSGEISEIPLFFNTSVGKMNGNFKLVFVIDN